MSRYLPYSGFKWLNQKEISDFCLNSISENSSIGYILEVDLKSEADSELVKLVVMTNVFFNNQERKIEIKRFMCVKKIKSSFFSNN